MIRIKEYLITAGAVILGTLAVTPANAAAPSLEQLANIAYTGIYEHAVTLRNGR